MSSRIASASLHVLARPVQLPELRPAAAAPPPPDGKLAEAQKALAGALDHSAQLQEELTHLEKSVAGHEAEAYQRGCSDGREQGKKDAAQEQQPALERTARAIADMATLRARLRRETEQELVKLSVEIARRILNREVNVDPDALSGVLRAALEKLQAGELTRVKVHPQYADSIRQQLAHCAVPASVEVIADTALEPGDIQLETVRGTLDASVATQLSEVERGFVERFQ
jgi:flagellar assembly protein FliH